MKFWYKTSSSIPEANREVLGYNENWIDVEKNPEGICICFITDEGYWNINQFCMECDEYHLRMSREAIEVELPDYEDNEDFFVDKPTHWIEKNNAYNLDVLFSLLFKEIKHGDQDYQDWLEDKMAQFLLNVKQ